MAASAAGGRARRGSRGADGRSRAGSGRARRACSSRASENSFMSPLTLEAFARDGNSFDGAAMSGRVDDYDFALPDELIAQRPPSAARRCAHDGARSGRGDNRASAVCRSRPSSLGQASCWCSTIPAFCRRGIFPTTGRLSFSSSRKSMRRLGNVSSSRGARCGSGRRRAQGHNGSGREDLRGGRTTR